MHNQIQIHTKKMSAKERVRVKWGNTRKLSREVENKLQSGKKTSGPVDRGKDRNIKQYQV